MAGSGRTTGYVIRSTPTATRVFPRAASQPGNLYYKLPICTIYSHEPARRPGVYSTASSRLASDRHYSRRPCNFCSHPSVERLCKNQRTGQRSTPFILEDPFSEHEYQEVRWYMEEFAMRDPFAQARAKQVMQSQLRYGKQLVSAIRPFIDEVLGIKSEGASARPWRAVHLLVAGNGTESSLHSLLWEIIERVECCSHPTFFAITRVAKRIPNDVQPILPGKKPSNSEQHFRILYVSARPGLEADISYRAISRHIWELRKRIDGQRPQISLDFVRPGTWTKFQSVLKDRGEGYYDLVHFDMHGTISKRSSPQKFA